MRLMRIFITRRERDEKREKKKRNFDGAFFSKKSQLMERVCC